MDTLDHQDTFKFLPKTVTHLIFSKDESSYNSWEWGDRYYADHIKTYSVIYSDGKQRDFDNYKDMCNYDPMKKRNFQKGFAVCKN